MPNKNWRSVLSIVLGSVAVCIPFAIRGIDFAAVGEPTGTVLAVTMTWLPVICAPLGFVLNTLEWRSIKAGHWQLPPF